MDYIDKTLIVLCATSGGLSVISFGSVIGATLTTGIIKVLQITRNKKKKHHKILVLAKGKVNGIHTVVSQPLIDLEISHEEFKRIVKEKDKY